MGNCGSTTGAVTLNSETSTVNSNTPEELKISKQIDRMLREEERRLAKQIKILLLGEASTF